MLKQRKSLKKLESILTIQDQEERDEEIQRIVLSVGDIYENVIHDNGNQASGKAMVTEHPPVSTLTEDPSTSSTFCVLRIKSGPEAFEPSVGMMMTTIQKLWD
ncbi:hypothetical protein PoB_003994900 [Plakobranchus ocellatus]|uniref:Uncharacterized protein n=1 Tax=Plakobranchus ocellatus TaxID=259542 RepID=A0AAV4B0B3_9GAST|nr:hypothetical protein PoB_003994900 [Plakobranchus ocellatus]